MITLEYKNIEIDCCLGCRSIWLDLGELELLLAQSSMDCSNLFIPAKNSKEKTFKCPICTKKMEKVNFKDSGIILDRCIKGCGIWFDQGELEKILKFQKQDSTEPITKFLTDTFTKFS